MDSTWAPFTLPWNDSPIDLSFVFAEEKPAGKHGFLGADGGRLRFADGTEARFWGTCFNSGANFPSHANSEMVAHRLAKFGVNMMRTHQMDAEWATPNIFQFNRAKPTTDTRHLHEESLDRLDYLIHCLRGEGVYIYLDLLTYRQFLMGDAVDAVDQLPAAAKPYCYFDLRLIELQKEFNESLWTHVNPYTHLAYKDDPAIALTELVNEADLFTQKAVLEPYRTRLEGMYREWADKNQLTVVNGPVDFTQPDAQMARFFVQVQRDYNREMIGHLRSIGVRIPIAGTNWSRTLGVLESQLDTDFTDTHWYWNFPRWESPDGTDTTPMVGAVENGDVARPQGGGFAHGAFQRTLNRPLFVSEWDHAWPAPYRAESPLAYAAVSALQGWSGMTIHTYRYGTWGPVDRLGGGGSTINGVTYRNHFDSFNDPAKFGLFPQAALILRRGDVRPSDQSVAVRIPEGDGSWRLSKPAELPALLVRAELERVGMELPGDPSGADRTVGPEEEAPEVSKGSVRSSTGELGRDWKRRYGWIDTPRTKVAYGFLGCVGKVDLEGLELDVRTDFATIALSSLTDEPIDGSTSLLLTAVGRSDNTGARYDHERRRQLDFGHAPVLIEVIEADVRVKTNNPNLKVWLISDRGEAVIRLPAEYEEGTLSFSIGPQPSWNPSTIYYLIRM